VDLPASFGKGIEILMAPVPFDQMSYKRQWWEDESSQNTLKVNMKKLFIIY